MIFEIYFLECVLCHSVIIICNVVWLNYAPLFSHYSPLKPKDLPIEQLIVMFKTSKARKPLRGAIILNRTLDKVINNN